MQVENARYFFRNSRSVLFDIPFIITDMCQALRFQQFPFTFFQRYCRFLFFGDLKGLTEDQMRLAFSIAAEDHFVCAQPSVPAIFMPEPEFRLRCFILIFLKNILHMHDQIFQIAGMDELQ